MADEIYFKTDRQTITVLKRKEISACKYSNEILEFLLQFEEEKKEYFGALFNRNTIIKRQKACK